MPLRTTRTEAPQSERPWPRALPSVPRSAGFQTFIIDFPSASELVQYESTYGRVSCAGDSPYALGFFAGAAEEQPIRPRNISSESAVLITTFRT